MYDKTMRYREFEILSLTLCGLLLLFALGSYAQTTLPKTSHEIAVTAQTSIIKKAQTSREVPRTLERSATYREGMDVWPQFVSEIPSSHSLGTVTPTTMAAKAMEVSVRLTVGMKRDQVAESSWSSTESSNSDSTYDVASVSNETPGVAPISEVASNRTNSIEEAPTTTQIATHAPKKAKVTLDSLRIMVKQLMMNSGAGFMRKLLQADMSPDCSIGLLKFARAIQELEPWALRRLLQGTLVGLGAYDECIETVVRDEQGIEKVRGQYCDVHVLPTEEVDAFDILLPAFMFTLENVGKEQATEITDYYQREVHVSVEEAYFTSGQAASFEKHTKSSALPGIRIGLCTIDACDERDLASIARSRFRYSIFGYQVVGSYLNVTVKDCVTNLPEGINSTQASIIAFLAVLASIIVSATALEVFTKSWGKHRKTGIFYQSVMAFSALANTRLLLANNKDKKSESSCYQFIHGLRVLTMFWICLGHSYVIFSENISRLFNGALLFRRWDGVIILAAYLGVDTFFFLSGYMLYYVLDKQRRNRVVVFIIALFRRLIRTTVPVFFMIMCIYLLPLIATGPYSKEFYDRFYKEVREHWWHLLLQIRNWKQDDVQTVTMLHLWYLSADYQLFVVSVIVIQIFGANKWRVVAVFSVLSLVCCGASAWQLYGTDMMPFIVSSHPAFRSVVDTAKYFYPRPYYHGVCFFFGCVTFILVEKFRRAQISKTVQAFLWSVSLFCGLYCIFMKVEWQRTDDIPPVAKRMFFAFIDRILWTVFLVWFAFASITGRGGFLNKFLSWRAFVPLARLSFGVYLIHLPFYLLSRRLSRELSFYSHYTLVSDCFSVLVWSYILSYFLFIACEAPVGRLDKLAFVRGPQTGVVQPSCTKNRVQYKTGTEGTQEGPVRTKAGGTSKRCLKEDSCAVENGAYFNESCDIVRCRL